MVAEEFSNYLSCLFLSTRRATALSTRLERVVVGETRHVGCIFFDGAEIDD